MRIFAPRRALKRKWGPPVYRTIVATFGESRSILLLILAMCRLVRAERVDDNDADGVAAGMKAEAEAAKATIAAQRASIIP